MHRKLYQTIGWLEAEPVAGHRLWLIRENLQGEAPLFAEHVKVGERAIAWILLNPSTADAAEDDPTIRRVVGFSRASGYDLAVVANLFTQRSTDPGAFDCAASGANVAGSDELISHLPYGADRIVCAWGSGSGLTDPGAFMRRAKRVWYLLQQAKVTPYCLGVTMGGWPRHPLYVPAHHELYPWTYPFPG